MFNVREGNLDDLDLSGLQIGLKVHFPELVTNGNWQIGVVLDQSATDAQADAVEQIFAGKLGGPFGDMAGLVSGFSIERATLAYADDRVSVGDTSFTYEPLRGQDGTPTTMSNAAMGFAPVFEIGNASGRLEAFGHGFDASYGEAADFEYASGSHEHVRA